MKVALILVVASLALLSVGCSGEKDSVELSRIAFGSCARQDLAQPIWEGVRSVDPQLWIWAGDNIYGDSADGEVLASKYAQLDAKPGYVALKESTPIVGTWDDHDYGLNNGGKHFEGKQAAQKALLDFLGTPTDSGRRKQEGVYWAHTYGSGEGEVKVILLDCRYHRDDVGEENADLLGESQWAWLEHTLRASRAPLNIIVSGIQVLPQDHRYEKWMQFPQSRQRLFELIADSGVRGVIFLSGDRHIAEISKMEVEGIDYPLYDITSSSMTHAWTSFPGETNRHRVGEVYHENNFGLLEIDWENKVVNATIRNEAGEAKRSAQIPF